MDSVAVIIPCYNEKTTIGKVIDDFKKYLPNIKIYVYDNNSNDGSDIIAKENGAIVRYEKERGKGNVLKSMFEDIDARCYVLVDADDTYSLKNVKEMIDMVLNDGVDMVIGDRLSSTYFKENDRLFHGIGNKLVKMLINKLFNTDIKDPLSGFRCLSHKLVKNISIKSHGFEVETEITIKAIKDRYIIKNYIIDYKNRGNGSKSKLHTFFDGIKIIHTILINKKNLDMIPKS